MWNLPASIRPKTRLRATTSVPISEGRSDRGTSAICLPQLPPQTYGVFIATPSPSTALPGATNNVIANNVVSGNLVGVNIAGQGSGASGSAAAQGVPIGEDLLVGNKIGTDFTGMAPDPNFEYGVYIDDSSKNTIGGTGAGQGNLISANGIDGVEIFGGNTQRTSKNAKSAPARNFVIDNLIGVNANGAGRKLYQPKRSFAGVQVTTGRPDDCARHATLWRRRDRFIQQQYRRCRRGPTDNRGQHRRRRLHLTQRLRGQCLLCAHGQHGPVECYR